MKRTATALALIPAVVALVLYAPPWAFLGALALAGLAAHREFDALVAALGIARAGWPGAALGLAVLLAPERMAYAAVVLAALALMALAMRSADLSRAAAGAAAGLLGIVYVFGAWRCAAALREIGPHWLMMTLAAVWTGDTAAFGVGRAFGRRKLAPRVSPSKSWEGALASAAASVGAAAAYAQFLMPPAAMAMALGVGAAANLAGQIGDLVESALKRGAGWKDSGSALPGHGGWLDRLDSSLFAIPAAYAILRALTLS
jgi:phosphatidate cytidylyltransferase